MSGVRLSRHYLIWDACARLGPELVWAGPFGRMDRTKVMPMHPQASRWPDGHRSHSAHPTRACDHITLDRTLRHHQFQIWAAPRDLWWMRRARPPCQVPETEQRALSTLQRSRLRRVDKRSASTIGLAVETLLAAATQIWNCWKTRRLNIDSGLSTSCYDTSCANSGVSSPFPRMRVL